MPFVIYVSEKSSFARHLLSSLHCFGSKKSVYLIFYCVNKDEIMTAVGNTVKKKSEK